jgi:hypothetical protein
MGGACSAWPRWTQFAPSLSKTLTTDAPGSPKKPLSSALTQYAHDKFVMAILFSLHAFLGDYGFDSIQ